MEGGGAWCVGLGIHGLSGSADRGWHWHAIHLKVGWWMAHKRWARRVWWRTRRVSWRVGKGNYEAEWRIFFFYICSLCCVAMVGMVGCWFISIIGAQNAPNNCIRWYWIRFKAKPASTDDLHGSMGGEIESESDHHTSCNSTLHPGANGIFIFYINNY